MRRLIIGGLLAILAVWGLLVPPGGQGDDPFGRDEEGWNEGRLRLHLRDLVAGSPVAGARVLLSTPGGRQIEERSDDRGRVELPLFLLDDFLFRLVVESPGHERLDHRLRGADLARRNRREVLLLPLGARRSLAGCLACREPGPGRPQLRYRWWLEGDALRPAGREASLEPDAAGAFLIRGLPPGARFELRAFLPLGAWGSSGLAGAERRGRLGTTDLDLGEILLQARTVEGRVRDEEGQPLASEPLGVRLAGWDAPMLRTETDRLGRYALAIPDLEEIARGRAALGRGEERLVGLPWEARGDQAATLVRSRRSGDAEVRAAPPREAPRRLDLSGRRAGQSPSR